MKEDKIGNLLKISLESFEERVCANPQVDCLQGEIVRVLKDLSKAVTRSEYVPSTPTTDNPSLSEDYIFDTNDEKLVLKDLTKEHFVAKIKDLGKGACNRKQKGLQQEYLYVFQYPCKMYRRDLEESGIDLENVLIYIKINNRKVPYKKIFVVSFHKNRIKLER
ncbi:MAG: hypothetical protein R3Y47_10055 [Lachnospiraceae bacterium]